MSRRTGPTAGRDPRVPACLLAAVLLLAACGRPGGPEPSGAPGPAADGTPAAAPAGDSTPAMGLRGRTGILAGPDPRALVLLYYDLAGLPLPLDQWTQEGSAVQFAQPFDQAREASRRREELVAAARAVQGVGFLQLTREATLGGYDADGGQFNLMAFGPGPDLVFAALGRRVSVGIANPREAAAWRVSAEEARDIRARAGPDGAVLVDLRLRVMAVQPDPEGGSISTEVVAYDVRDRTGAVLGRVPVPAR